MKDLIIFKNKSDIIKYPGDWEGYKEVFLFGTEVNFKEVCKYYQDLELALNGIPLKVQVWIRDETGAEISIYEPNSKKAYASAVLSDLSDEFAESEFLAYIGDGEDLCVEPNMTVGAVFIHA